MACANIINGTTVGVFVDDVLVAYATDGSFQITHETRATTNKDSEGWQDQMEGLRSATVSVGALLAAPAGAGGFASLADKVITDRVTVDLKIQSAGNEQGSQPVMPNVYSGKFWVDSLNMNLGSPEDNATWEGSFSSCGKITKA